MEGSKSSSDLLKVAALERPLEGPQLEAERLVVLSQEPSERSKISASSGTMSMDKE